MIAILILRIFPQDVRVIIYVEQLAGNLIITDTNKVEIYILDKMLNKLTSTNAGQNPINKTYKRSRKKAKEVKFSDFKTKDL